MTETLEHVEEFASQEPREESASGEALGASAPDAQPPAESDLSAANAAVIRQMVLAAQQVRDNMQALEQTGTARTADLPAQPQAAAALSGCLNISHFR